MGLCSSCLEKTAASDHAGVDQKAKPSASNTPRTVKEDTSVADYPPLAVEEEEQEDDDNNNNAAAPGRD
jgi:hypothetical protein